MRISDWSSDVCSSDLVLRAEVALAVDQRIAVRERLRHQHHRLVAGGVAVRVELADHAADGARRLLRLGRRTERQLAHRVAYPTLHGLEPVADEGQGAVENHVHRVVALGALAVIPQWALLEHGEGGRALGAGYEGEAWQGITRTNPQG